MSRWILYHTLTFLDVLRLWPTVQHHIVIVAGICFPILLLLGLKNGHVAELREDLLRSPSGRQIVFWSGQQGDLLTYQGVQQMEQDDSRIEVVIPEVQRLVAISSVDSSGDTHRLESVTLYSTKQGDPILRQYGVQNSQLEKGELVLLKGVAQSLHVNAGDQVKVSVTRAREGVVETASVDLKVSAIVDSGDSEANSIGYVDVETLSQMEQYVMGYQVPEFHWPAFRTSAPDNYSSYLIVCESGGQLTDEDIRTLEERGYSVTRVESEALKTLYGALEPEAASELTIYQLGIEGSDNQQTLNMAPGQLSRLTEADDVVLPWNEPITTEVAGKSRTIIGLSIPQRTWLRLYLRERDTGFGFDESTFSVQLFGEDSSEEPVYLQYSDKISIPLKATYLSVPLDAPEVSSAPKPEVPAKEEEVQAEAPKEMPTNAGEESATKPDSENEPKTDGEANKEAVTDGSSKKEAAEIKEPQNASELKGNSEEDTVPKPAAETEPAAVTKEEPEPSSSGESDDAPTKSVEQSEAETPMPVEEAAEGKKESAEGSVASSGPQSAGVGEPETAICVVPMDLLAHLRAAKAGEVEYDPTTQLFVALPSETLYPKARLYATTIDDVPSVVQKLRGEGFAVMSEETRIREIHQQDHSLQLLVLIVGTGVFLFGTVTVVSVLLDSTDRKRGTIGILRVMGVSRGGVFYMIFLRSAIIGVLAAILTIGFGWLMAMLLEWQPPADSFLLPWKPVIHLIIRPIDIGIIIAGSLLCCMVGSLMPANRASRLDPFDAILEGRFR